jgi:hypothetical protein
MRRDSIENSPVIGPQRKRLRRRELDLVKTWLSLRVCVNRAERFDDRNGMQYSYLVWLCVDFRRHSCEPELGKLKNVDAPHLSVCKSSFNECVSSHNFLIS